MNEKIFLEKFIETLDCEENVTLNTLLRNLEEWDSLGLVSFIAMVNVEYNKNVETIKVLEAKTILDLYNLIDIED